MKTDGLVVALAALLPVAASASGLLPGGDFEWAAGGGTGGWRALCFYAAGYGARVEADGMPLDAWTALSGWKVPKTRPLPEARADTVRVAAAANEAEAVQLILRPTEDLAGARVSCGGGQRLADGVLRRPRPHGEAPRQARA